MKRKWTTTKLCKGGIVVVKNYLIEEDDPAKRAAAVDAISVLNQVHDLVLGGLVVDLDLDEEAVDLAQRDVLKATTLHLQRVIGAVPPGSTVSKLQQLTGQLQFVVARLPGGLTSLPDDD